MATGLAFAALVGGTLQTVASIVAPIVQIGSLISSLYDDDSSDFDTDFQPISSPISTPDVFGDKQVDEIVEDVSSNIDEVNVEDEAANQALKDTQTVQRNENRRRSLFTTQAFSQGGVLASGQKPSILG